MMLFVTVIICSIWYDDDVITDSTTHTQHGPLLAWVSLWVMAILDSCLLYRTGTNSFDALVSPFSDYHTGTGTHSARERVVPCTGVSSSLTTHDQY